MNNPKLNRADHDTRQRFGAESIKCVKPGCIDGLYYGDICPDCGGRGYIGVRSVIYLRHKKGEPPDPRRFADPGGAIDELCVGCWLKIEPMQPIALVPVGPGSDIEEQERCRDGRFYNAIAIPLHWACATGEAA